MNLLSFTSFVFCMVVASCGHKAASPTTQEGPTSDVAVTHAGAIATAPVPSLPPAMLFDLPQAQADDAVITTSAWRPAVTVWLEANGTIAIAAAPQTGAWATKPAKLTPVVDVADYVATLPTVLSGDLAAEFRTIPHRRSGGPTTSPPIDASFDVPLTAVHGVPVTQLPRTSVAIFAASRGPATTLIMLLSQVNSAIAVTHQGEVTLLQTGYAQLRPSIETQNIVELSLSPQRLEVRQVTANIVPIQYSNRTDVGWSADHLDRPALSAAVAKLRATMYARYDRKKPGLAYVRLSIAVTDNVSVREFVDVLMAATELTPGPISVRYIGPAGGPPTLEFGLPHVVAGNGIDAAALAPALENLRAKFLFCYAAELVVEPFARGTVQTKFTITPRGKLQNIEAHGNNNALAQCVGNVLTKLRVKLTTKVSTVIDLPIQFFRLTAPPVSPDGEKH